MLSAAYGTPSFDPGRFSLPTHLQQQVIALTSWIDIGRMKKAVTAISDTAASNFGAPICAAFGSQKTTRSFKKRTRYCLKKESNARYAMILGLGGECSTTHRLTAEEACPWRLPAPEDGEAPSTSFDVEIITNTCRTKTPSIIDLFLSGGRNGRLVL